MSTDSSAHTTPVGNAHRDAASARKERWVCDICKIQEFDDFEEACRHEESCTYGLEQNHHHQQPVACDSSTSTSCSNAASAEDDDHVRDCHEAKETHVKPASIAPEHQPFVKTTKAMYVCDVCKVAHFDNYDEACRHEDSCTLVAPAAVPPSAEVKSADAKAAATSVPVHSSENVDAADGDKPAWDGDANDDEVVAVSSKDVSAKETTRNGLIGLSTAKANTKDAGVATKSKGTTDAPIFQKRKQPSRGAAASAVAATTSGGGGGKRAKDDAAAATAGATAGAAAKANPDAKALASLFTSPRPGRGNGGGKGDGPSPTTAFVQEHRNAEVAAKFAAERRAKAQADRERKRKREEDAMARERENVKKGGSNKKPCAAAGATIDDESDADSNATDEVEVVGSSTRDKRGSKKAVAGIFARPRKRAVPSKSDNGDSTTTGATAAAASVSTSNASAKLKTRPTYLLAPKFPVPSHTIGVNADAVGREGTETHGEGAEGRKVSCSITTDKIANSADALVGTARYQDGRRSLRDCSLVPCNIPLVCDNRIPLYCNDSADELGQAFASVMSPPPLSIDDDAESSEELWSTKYTIDRVPDDVCGDTNRDSAVSLMTFINEWKAHRAEFVRKMEEKRKSLGSQRRKKTSNSRRTYYNDDDLWYDSDEDDYGLCSVFLLNGPHGTGKSALVHAAASQAGCVLVEINTTEKRSGSALKRAIEECTQSHSSLALLKRGANPVFSNFGAETTAKSQEVLSDSSDESDGCDDDEDEKDGGDRGRLAIILIDEVDNIFETEGDAGFWVALANLTKKAKCPIILTSTAVPSLLEASSIRYQAASMTRPSPLECASKMRLVAKNEEVVSSGVDDRDDEWGQDELCCIAELCNCDLRSILNEMQLHSHGSSLLRREKEESGGMALDTRPPFTIDAPTITEITPRFVKANSYNILTIKGDNFANSTGLLATEVVIGGHVTPALRVIGDNTILAACAPCALPKGVDSSGSFEDSFEHCITCRYAPVVVKRKTKTGLVLRSDTCVPSDVNSFGRHFNVVFNFPEVEGRLESMCIKKEKARQKRREESQRALSSDDDDFVIPVRKSKDPENDATTSGRGTTNLVSMTSETMEESSLVTTGVDADALLEKAMKDFVLDKAIEQILPKSRKEQKPRDNEKDLSELTQIAKGLEYSSDAALLEDSFSCLAIPSLSGAVRGFGSDFLDSESLSGNMNSGTSSKKLRNTSAKPPTIERIFTSGWNDSAFFFGSSDSYVTWPTSKRDRSELSKAHFYSNMMHSISNTNKSDADDNSKSSSSMSSLTLASSLSNAETNSSSQGSLGSSQSDDATFLQLCASSPVYSLPSMLRGSAELRFREHMCLLATRRRERAAEAITSSSALLDDHGTRNSFCFGLNEITNEEPSDIPIDVNERFVLDYLPCLKAMAAAENKAEMRYSALKAKNPDALGLQDTTSSRRATRRSAKSGRTHYFDRLVDYNRMHHEEACALAKRTGTDLSRMILSYSVPS